MWVLLQRFGAAAAAAAAAGHEDLLMMAVMVIRMGQLTATYPCTHSSKACPMGCMQRVIPPRAFDPGSNSSQP